MAMKPASGSAVVDLPKPNIQEIDVTLIGDAPISNIANTATNYMMTGG